MGKSRNVIFLAGLLILSGCAGGAGDPYHRAVEQYGMGRIDLSVREYREAMAANPDDVRPKFNVAVIYQDAGRLDEAEVLYRAILDRQSDHAPAWSNLASIQEKRGLMSEAEKSYLHAVESDPENPWIVSQYGFFLLRAGRLTEAGTKFEHALRVNRKCANAWYGLGMIAEKNGDNRTALQNYDRAVVYNPNDLEAYLRAADIRISQGERGAAVGLLRKAVGLAPERGDLSLRLGRLLREEGRLKDAEKALERARKNGAVAAECDRELSIVYGKLAEESAARAGVTQ
ncbi:MAG: tetratricopeptide repeat protein [Desulfobacteraceae bacterium]|nr:tetratricopeptide repeat protein [Desulfobacteraceae bacterium]